MPTPDSTAEVRRDMTHYLNARIADRPTMEAEYGKVWDTAELVAEFEVVGFLAPFVDVVRKADGARGSMVFQHWPRFYFDFQEHD